MTSWYDQNIVTAAGEAILGRYDDWAIKLLRRQQLVWSGWQGNKLKGQVAIDRKSGWGYRLLVHEDWATLRLFLLSLLWRAAVSKMPEFQEVVLPREDLDQIGAILVAGSLGPPELYPATLIQLSTKGPRHNHTPITGVKELAPSGPRLGRSMRFFRFYFDGLIVHFERDVRTAGELNSLGRMVVGSDPTLGVLARPYEGSFQAETLASVMADTWIDWPHMRPQILAAMGLVE
ncbi:MAG: hypothetical protein ACREE0_04960 [Phenylobacterium sp.]